MSLLGLIRVVFPALLLSAAFLRLTLWSMGYFILFIWFFLMRPLAPVLYKQRYHVSKSYFAAVSIYSSASLLGQVVSQICIASGALTPTRATELFGWTEINDVLEGFQLLGIDIVMCAFSFFCLFPVFSNSARTTLTAALPTTTAITVLQWSTAAMLLLSGMMYPSFLSLPYFVAFVCYFIAKVYEIQPVIDIVTGRPAGTLHYWDVDSGAVAPSGIRAGAPRVGEFTDSVTDLNSGPGVGPRGVSGLRGLRSGPSFSASNGGYHGAGGTRGRSTAGSLAQTSVAGSDVAGSGVDDEFYAMLGLERERRRRVSLYADPTPPAMLNELQSQIKRQQAEYSVAARAARSGSVYHATAPAGALAAAAASGPGAGNHRDSVATAPGGNAYAHPHAHAHGPGPGPGGFDSVSVAAAVAPRGADSIGTITTSSGAMLRVATPYVPLDPRARLLTWAGVAYTAAHLVILYAANLPGGTSDAFPDPLGIYSIRELGTAGWLAALSTIATALLFVLLTEFLALDDVLRALVEDINFHTFTRKLVRNVRGVGLSATAAAAAAAHAAASAAASVPVGPAPTPAPGSVAASVAPAHSVASAAAAWERRGVAQGPRGRSGTAMGGMQMPGMHPPGVVDSEGVPTVTAAADVRKLTQALSSAAHATFQVSRFASAAGGDVLTEHHPLLGSTHGRAGKITVAFNAVKVEVMIGLLHLARTLCHIVLLFCALLRPSLLSFGFMILFVITCCLPGPRLKAGVAVVVFYSLVVTFVQYITSVPGLITQSAALDPVGIQVMRNPFFSLLNSIAPALVCGWVYAWSQLTPVDQLALDQRDRKQTTNLAANWVLRAMQFAKASLLYLCDKLALGLLFLVSLYTVNIIHAVFLLIFIVFFSVRRVAAVLWPLFVIYAGLVLLSLYGFGVIDPWVNGDRYTALTATAHVTTPAAFVTVLSSEASAGGVPLDTLYQPHPDVDGVARVRRVPTLMPVAGVETAAPSTHHSAVEYPAYYFGDADADADADAEGAYTDADADAGSLWARSMPAPVVAAVSATRAGLASLRTAMTADSVTSFLVAAARFSADPAALAAAADAAKLRLRQQQPHLQQEPTLPPAPTTGGAKVVRSFAAWMRFLMRPAGAAPAAAAANAGIAVTETATPAPLPTASPFTTTSAADSPAVAAPAAASPAMSLRATPHSATDSDELIQNIGLFAPTSGADWWRSLALYYLTFIAAAFQWAIFRNSISTYVNTMLKHASPGWLVLRDNVMLIIVYAGVMACSLPYQASVFKLGTALFVIVSLLIHMFAQGNPRPILLRVWAFAVFYMAAVFVLVYLYQFQIVRTWIHDIYPLHRFTPQDMGFEQASSSSFAVLVSLSGPVFSFVLAVMYVRTMLDNTLAPGDLERYHNALRELELLPGSQGPLTLAAQEVEHADNSLAVSGFVLNLQARPAAVAAATPGLNRARTASAYGPHGSATLPIPLPSKHVGGAVGAGSAAAYGEDHEHKFAATPRSYTSAVAAAAAAAYSPRQSSADVYLPYGNVTSHGHFHTANPRAPPGKQGPLPPPPPPPLPPGQPQSPQSQQQVAGAESPQQPGLPPLLSSTSLPPPRMAGVPGIPPPPPPMPVPSPAAAAAATANSLPLQSSPQPLAQGSAPTLQLSLQPLVRASSGATAGAGPGPSVFLSVSPPMPDLTPLSAAALHASAPGAGAFVLQPPTAAPVAPASAIAPDAPSSANYFPLPSSSPLSAPLAPLPGAGELPALPSPAPLPRLAPGAAAAGSLLPERGLSRMPSNHSAATAPSPSFSAASAAASAPSGPAHDDERLSAGLLRLRQGESLADWVARHPRYRSVIDDAKTIMNLEATENIARNPLAFLTLILAPKLILEACGAVGVLAHKHVYKIVFIFAWLLATVVSGTNLINLGLVVLIVIFLFLGKGRHGWALVALYATAMFLVRYVFQIGQFDRNENAEEFAYIGLGFWAGQKAVFHVWGEALLIALCTVQRVSYNNWRPPELTYEEKLAQRRAAKREKQTREWNRRIALLWRRRVEAQQREQDNVALQAIQTYNVSSTGGPNDNDGESALSAAVAAEGLQRHLSAHDSAVAATTANIGSPAAGSVAGPDLTALSPVASMPISAVAAAPAGVAPGLPTKVLPGVVHSRAIDINDAIASTVAAYVPLEPSARGAVNTAGAAPAATPAAGARPSAAASAMSLSLSTGPAAAALGSRVVLMPDVVRRVQAARQTDLFSAQRAAVKLRGLQQQHESLQAGVARSGGEPSLGSSGSFGSATGPSFLAPTLLQSDSFSSADGSAASPGGVFSPGGDTVQTGRASLEAALEASARAAKTRRELQDQAHQRQEADRKRRRKTQRRDAFSDLREDDPDNASSNPDGRFGASNGVHVGTAPSAVNRRMASETMVKANSKAEASVDDDAPANSSQDAVVHLPWVKVTVLAIVDIVRHVFIFLFTSFPQLGMQITLFLLLCSAILRANFMSIVDVCIVLGIYAVLGSRAISRIWTAFIFVVATRLIWQYFIGIDAPSPWWNWPWADLSVDRARWLLVGNFSVAELQLEFFIVFMACFQRKYWVVQARSRAMTKAILSQTDSTVVGSSRASGALLNRAASSSGARAAPAFDRESSYSHVQSLNRQATVSRSAAPALDAATAAALAAAGENVDDAEDAEAELAKLNLNPFSVGYHQARQQMRRKAAAAIERQFSALYEQYARQANALQPAGIAASAATQGAAGTADAPAHVAVAPEGLISPGPELLSPTLAAASASSQQPQQQSLTTPWVPLPAGVTGGAPAPAASSYPGKLPMHVARTVVTDLWDEEGAVNEAVKSVWPTLRFIFMLLIDKILFIVIFILSTYQANFVRVGYFIMSIFVLFNKDLYLGDIKGALRVWSNLQRFNVLVLGLMVIYQTPYMADFLDAAFLTSTTAIKWSSVIGIARFRTTGHTVNSFSADGALQQVLIFLVVEIQRAIFYSAAYADVVAFWRSVHAQSVLKGRVSAQLRKEKRDASVQRARHDALAMQTQFEAILNTVDAMNEDMSALGMTGAATAAAEDGGKLGGDGRALQLQHFHHPSVEAAGAARSAENIRSPYLPVYTVSSPAPVSAVSAKQQQQQQQMLSLPTQSPRKTPSTAAPQHSPQRSPQRSPTASDTASIRFLSLNASAPPATSSASGAVDSPNALNVSLVASAPLSRAPSLAPLPSVQTGTGAGVGTGFGGPAGHDEAWARSFASAVESQVTVYHEFFADEVLWPDPRPHDWETQLLLEQITAGDYDGGIGYFSGRFGDDDEESVDATSPMSDAAILESYGDLSGLTREEVSSHMLAVETRRVSQERDALAERVAATTAAAAAAAAEAAAANAAALSAPGALVAFPQAPGDGIMSYAAANVAAANAAAVAAAAIAAADAAQSMDMRTEAVARARTAFYTWERQQVLLQQQSGITGTAGAGADYEEASAHEALLLSSSPRVLANLRMQEAEAEEFRREMRMRRFIVRQLRSSEESVAMFNEWEQQKQVQQDLIERIEKRRSDDRMRTRQHKCKAFFIEKWNSAKRVLLRMVDPVMLHTYATVTVRPSGASAASPAVGDALSSAAPHKVTSPLGAIVEDNNEGTPATEHRHFVPLPVSASPLMSPMSPTSQSSLFYSSYPSPAATAGSRATGFAQKGDTTHYNDTADGDGDAEAEAEAETAAAAANATEKIRIVVSPDLYDKPEDRSLLHILYLVLASYSQFVLVLVYLITAMLYPNFLTLFLVSCLLLYGLLQAPRASTAFVTFLFVYTACVCCAQFVFQLPIFCVTITGRAYSLHPDPACADFGSSTSSSASSGTTATDALVSGDDEWQRDHLFGLYKVNSSSSTFIAFIAGQFVALLLVVWHRSVLMQKGVWFNNEEELGDPILAASRVIQDRQLRVKHVEARRHEYEKEVRRAVKSGQDPRYVYLDSDDEDDGAYEDFDQMDDEWDQVTALSRVNSSSSNSASAAAAVAVALEESAYSGASINRYYNHGYGYGVRAEEEEEDDGIRPVVIGGDASGNDGGLYSSSSSARFQTAPGTGRGPLAPPPPPPLPPSSSPGDSVGGSGGSRDGDGDDDDNTVLAHGSALGLGLPHSSSIAVSAAGSANESAVSPAWRPALSMPGSDFVSPAPLSPRAIDLDIASSYAPYQAYTDSDTAMQSPVAPASAAVAVSTTATAAASATAFAPDAARHQSRRSAADATGRASVVDGGGNGGDSGGRYRGSSLAGSQGPARRSQRGSVASTLAGPGAASRPVQRRSRRGQDDKCCRPSPCSSRYAFWLSVPEEFKSAYASVLPRSGAAINSVKPGTDVYVYCFILELIAAVWIILAYSNMATTTISGVGSSLNSNFFQGDMVLTLFVQVMLVIFDRAIYLNRALFWKVVVHYVSLIFWGYCMFFSWPVGAMRGFVSNPALQFFFVLKALYFILSAHQIQSGFPPKNLPNVQNLTKDVALPRYLAFRIYRAIPFVFELRVLLDWYCTETSLDLWDAFKLEDIFETLYIAQRLIWTRIDKQRGKPVITILKIAQGLLVFILLILVLFVPLLLFSSANPGSESNNVVALEMRVQLWSDRGAYPLLQTGSLASMTGISDEGFRWMKRSNMVDSNDRQSSVQVLQPAAFGDNVWTISPAALGQLLGELDDSSELSAKAAVPRNSTGFAPYADAASATAAATAAAHSAAATPAHASFTVVRRHNATDAAHSAMAAATAAAISVPKSSDGAGTAPRARPTIKSSVMLPSHRAALRASGALEAESTQMYLEMVYIFTRKQPTERLSVTATARTLLSAETERTLATVIRNSQSSGASDYVLVKNVVPRYLRLPSTADPVILTPVTAYADAVFRLHVEETATTEGGPATIQRWWSAEQVGAESTAESLVLEPITLTTVNNPVWGVFFLASISYSVVAIYTVILFTIGQFVRLVFSGSTQRIIIEELADVSRLQRFCYGIYIARAHRLLRREEELYRKLVQIYRSPDKLIQLTARVDSAETLAEAASRAQQAPALSAGVATPAAPLGGSGAAGAGTVEPSPHVTPRATPLTSRRGSKSQ